MPGNRLNIYKKCDNNGIFDFEENKIYKIRFETSDFNKNCSVLEVFLEKTEESTEVWETENVFVHNEENVFVDEDVSIKIPIYSLYENTVFNISKEEDSVFFSKKITFLKGIPSKKSYDLAIKTYIPKELQNKAIIVSVKKNNKISSVGGSFKDGYIHTSLNFFGTFAVTFDSTAPSVTIKHLKRDTISPQNGKILITAFDELSGIGQYETKINGKWALTEYDPKNKLFTIYLKKHKLPKGIHRFQFSISDNKNNKTVKNAVVKIEG
jgi:hypothetical protein